MITARSYFSAQREFWVHLYAGAELIDEMGPYTDELDAMDAARRHGDDVWDLPPGVNTWRGDGGGAE
jgi:hypothetical protein